MLHGELDPHVLAARQARRRVRPRAHERLADRDDAVEMVAEERRDLELASELIGTVLGGTSDDNILRTEDEEALLAGPELRGSERGRMTLFVHGLAGGVFSRSKFTMTGSNVQYVDSYSATGLLILSSGFPKTSTVHYADSSTDIGLTLSLGAGLDVRMSEALSGRILIDFFNPTFLTRPDIRDPSVAGPTGSTNIQNHTRISVGIVWRLR